jgi:hypothetical protein
VEPEAGDVFRQETWGFLEHFLMGMSCDLIDKKVMNMAEFTSPTTGFFHHQTPRFKHQDRLSSSEIPTIIEI